MLAKFSDLAVVGALLVVNTVLSFMQEHRAAGVVETLRRRLQVSARVRREAGWQVIPARDLVPSFVGADLANLINEAALSAARKNKEEELVFKEISTGDQNDLQRATDIARSMVVEYGMSDHLGLVTYGRPAGRCSSGKFCPRQNLQ